MTTAPALVSKFTLYIAGAVSFRAAGFFSAALVAACPITRATAARTAAAQRKVTKHRRLLMLYSSFIDFTAGRYSQTAFISVGPTVRFASVHRLAAFLLPAGTPHTSK